MKTKSIKTLVASLIAIVICFVMLLGTTFAWFTDSISSTNNVIKTGNLKVNAYWMEATKDPETDEWTKFSNGPIFNNDKWEPGYVEAKHLKVTNEGSLAFKYKLFIQPNDAVSELADVIDVYYFATATKLNARSQVENGVNVGTLADLIADPDGAAYGILLPDGATPTNENEVEKEVAVTIAFKMQEDLGNEYQGLSIGSSFDIVVYATQYNFESDGFNNEYDANLDPMVTYLFTGKDINNSTTLSGKVSLSVNFKTSDYGDDARYGYGYEYIIRNGADYVLDLNGKTIVHDTVYENANKNAFTYLFVANHVGTKLTIEGEGKIISNNSEGYTCAVQGKDGTLVTINGGDYTVKNGIAVWAGTGSHIVINGGSYVNGEATTSHELIYSSGGVIDIYGGFFHNTDGNYTLNVEDRNRATSFINVYGGTFVNFDPSTGGQDPNNIKVADGYEVISETQPNGDVWYTVIKSA